MKKLLIIFSVLLCTNLFSQINFLDTAKIKNTINQEKEKLEQKAKEEKEKIEKQFTQNLQQKKDSIKIENVIYNRVNEQEAVWDNGIPIIPDDERIMNLIYQLNEQAITDVTKLTPDQVRIYRELGLEFYNKGMYQEADFYLSKIKNYSESKHVALKDIFTDNTKEIREQIKEELDKEYQEKLSELEQPKTELTPEQSEGVKKDVEFIKSLPTKLEEVSKEDLEALSQQISNQIEKLTKERDELIRTNGSQELIDSKDGSIKSLKKEKQVIDLNIDKEQLKEEKTIITRWLWGTGLTTAVLILLVFVVIQRKTIRVQDGEIETQLKDIAKKNTYLEHAARIIRHDMHSGINTYIPRGITSLEKRITPEEVQKLKIDAPLKMIKEGLNHTQKVYKSVYEFTNLVKQDVVLDKKEENIQELLRKYFDGTAYANQVTIDNLPVLSVNPVLFCNAIDNLVKNGLKYNQSTERWIKIYQDKNIIVVEDNGTGLTQKQFEKISINYLTRDNKDLDKESTGLGLNISQTILQEHGFDLACEKIETGTKMKITISNS